MAIYIVYMMYIIDCNNKTKLKAISIYIDHHQLCG